MCITYKCCLYFQRTNHIWTALLQNALRKKGHGVKLHTHGMYPPYKRTHSRDLEPSKIYAQLICVVPLGLMQLVLGHWLWFANHPLFLQLLFFKGWNLFPHFLNLGWTCDLLWSVESTGTSTVKILNQGLQKPRSFFSCFSGITWRSGQWVAHGLLCVPNQSCLIDWQLSESGQNIRTTLVNPNHNS